MNIKEFSNREFIGEQVFSYWEYDNSLPPEELDKLGICRSLVCGELDDNVLIAQCTDPLSPVDFMEINGGNKFLLDASVTPRYLTGSIKSQTKKVFYTKLDDENDIRKGTRLARFTINVFKNGNSAFGGPENKPTTSIFTKTAFERLDEKLEELKEQKNNEIFKECELGSFFFQVEFHNEEPFSRVKWSSSGITYDFLIKIINHIYGNIPENEK